MKNIVSLFRSFYPLIFIEMPDFSTCWSRGITCPCHRVKITNFSLALLKFIIYNDRVWGKKFGYMACWVNGFGKFSGIHEERYKKYKQASEYRQISNQRNFQKSNPHSFKHIALNPVSYVCAPYKKAYNIGIIYDRIRSVKLFHTIGYKFK